jgi:hypothetical protein
MQRAAAAVAMAAVMLGAAGVARAQRPSLAILGLTSEEGDDARAVAVTSALRDQAEDDPSVRLSSSRASLSQMTIMQDCEISDAECRVQVGSALKADQVIYGAVRRAGAHGHEVELHLFTSSDGSEVTAKRVIPASDTSSAQLAQHASALLAALRESPEAEEPPATQEDDAGPPPVPTVTPDVAPLTSEEQALHADTAEPPSDEVSSSNDWLGYSLLGLAGVSAGMTVFSWTQIQSANEDIEGYSNAVYEMNRSIADVCDEADKGVHYGFNDAMLGDVNSACSRGQTFQALQYVFMGVAAVSAGFGIYFLVDDDGESASAAAGTPRFALRASPDAALLDMRLDL